MNFFSKKTSIILVSLSAFFFAIGTVIVIFSHQFIDLAYTILSQKIFHREFNLEKWLPTIESLFVFPIFAVTAVNAAIFPKYEKKYKITLLVVCFTLIGFSILYASCVASDYHVNSDLAAEFILAGECNLEKSLLPTGYYYATELRTLNTEIFSAPIFWFTANWTVNKTLTTFFCCALLFVVTWFLLKFIDIKETWVKLFVSFMIFSPFSWQAMYIGTWGNYYLPHITICFAYLILFIKLCYNTPKHKKLLFLIFQITAFICGLSTIRYVLNFVIPVTSAAILLETNKKETAKITEFKKFWIDNFTVFVASTSLFSCGIGYVFSSTVIQHFYTLSHFNKIQFCTLGETSLLDLLRAILDTFGYQEGVSVMTPAGFINLLVIVGLVISIVNIKPLLKNENLSFIQRFILLFVIISFFFNTFIYYTVEFYNRYYYSILVLFFLIFAIEISNPCFNKIAKWIMGCCIGIAFISSCYMTILHFINNNENSNREGSINYLLENDYSFGYALFENANVITFLTDGQIEVGNLQKTEPSPGDFIPTEKYDYDKWLTLRRYYENNNDCGNIFLLLSTNEYNHAKDYAVIRNGKEVYRDDFFVIFDYPSHEAFKQSFNN